ncbi:MAG: glycosyl transferase, partial [Rhodospirillales bacterium]|nr:glycosyl transferase [Rhodospirillales bacterium]
MLIRGEVLDIPNERSSHIRPTPRGGGLAVLAVLVPLWLLVCALDPALPGRPLAAALLALPLAVLCWADDRQSLSTRTRFLLQILAVTWGMSTLPEGGLTQGWLPPSLDWVLSAMGWLWFVNLYNCMDGIDGIAGCQTAALGLGFIVLAALGMTPGFAPLGA